MDFRHVPGMLLLISVLIIAPLFGAIVDFFYLAILLLCLDQLRWSRGVLIAALACIFFSSLLLVTNPHVQDPFFSYFFARLALLLVLFGNTSPLWKVPGRTAFYWLFVIYVGSILYQWFGLPGSEFLHKLHADKIVEEGVAYRASGIFSGFFSAALIIGSLGLVLLQGSSLYGAFFISLGMLVVAFCSGRSIVVYLVVGLVALASRSPRVAIGVIFLICVTIAVVLEFFGASLSDNSSFQNSTVLFLQIWSVLSGDVSSTSAEPLLRDHYYLPNDWGVLLLGNNERPFSLQGVASDSGYIQLLFGAGMVGGIAYFATLCGFMVSRATAILITLLIAMIFVSFKGNAFIAIGVVDFLFLFAMQTGARERSTRYFGSAKREMVLVARNSNQ